MNEYLEMKINFGFLNLGNRQSDDVYSTVDRLIHEFAAYSQVYNLPEYGYSGKKIQCRLFSLKELACPAVEKIASSNGYSLTLVTSAENVTEDEENRTVGLNVRQNSVNYFNTVSEYIVNASDAVFLVWDGQEEHHGGILWTVMQLCKQRKIPYYLINTSSHENVTFALDFYDEGYDSEAVRSYVKKLYDYPHTSNATKHQKIFLSGLWVKLYTRYLKKFKIKELNEVSHDADLVLSPNYFNEDSPRAQNHKMLVEYFNYYDAKAIRASTMCRASIYFRSILPFIASVFIAVGFYAETVLKFAFGAPQVLGMSIWTILAGLGFMMHALVNIYSIYASKHKTIKTYRDEFVEARLIAEYLRILIHGAPYGFQLKSVFSKENMADRHVVAKLRGIVRQLEPDAYVQDAKALSELIENLERLADDQISYHDASIKRYSKISVYLNKLTSAVYIASAVIVISRGFFQFAVPYLSDVLHMSVPVHGVTVESFSKSAANMIALLVPAWASYFAGKLNMNNYEWLRKNSEKQKKAFFDLKDKLSRIKGRQRYDYHEVEDIMNEITVAAEEDYVNWYFRVSSQKFTRI